jgi:hypothetical protein
VSGGPADVRGAGPRLELSPAGAFVPLMADGLVTTVRAPLLTLRF